jgi:hypothetical protein
MTQVLKKVENVTYNEEFVRGNYNTISGGDLSFLLVPKTGSTYSHLWMGPLFSLPVNDFMANPYGISYADGGLSGTSSEFLVTNVGDNIIIGDIGESAYDMAIDGLNFSLTIPLNSSYTGITSGLSTTTLYSSFMKTQYYDQKSTTGPCACSVMDGLYSEQSSVVTTQINQGMPEEEGINPESNGYYNSGLVYLFSDDIRKPNVSATTVVTTNSWANGFGNDCPYTLYKKFPFNYMDDTLNGYYRDQPVGVVDLYGGIITIFNEDLVNAFDFSTSSGGTSTSGATFPVSAASSTFRTLDVEMSINTTLIAGKNEFNFSNNPTWNPVTCGNKIYITYFELYDSAGKLVGMGVPQNPIEKAFDDTLVITANFKL